VHGGHDHAHEGHGHGQHGHGGSLTRVAAQATLHCLTGCAIGEVLGMVIGTALGWGNTATIVLAIILAFFFGYTLTTMPLLRSGLALAVVVPLALASDTFSVAVMEIVDNTVMLTVPGAMEAGLGDLLFWNALALSLAIAFVFAWPVNRYLIGRGQGHAVVHAYHGGEAPAEPPKLNVARLAAIGIVAILFTVGVGVAGATIAGEEEHDSGSMTAMSEEHGAEAPVASGLAAADGRYSLELTDQLAPGRAQDVRLRILDAGGQPVTEMDKHGGVRLHLIVVRRDLADYQHLHPTLGADGTWKTRIRLPEAGVYRAFADFSVDGEKTVLGRDLFAAGRFVPRPLPPPTRTATIDGYEVALHGAPAANVEGELGFEVTRGGTPVDVEPYLGAQGHLVALREGDLAYLHVHPVEQAEAGKVRFMATFPTAGRYRLFLQFKDDGRVHTVPFTVAVRR
jgi:hypothetical protein